MFRGRGVAMVTVIALLTALSVWISVDTDRRVAATATAERLTADSPYTLAVEVARQIAGGTLADLTDLIITTGEQPTDAIVSAGLAGYLDTCPRPDTRPCNRTATLLTQPTELPQATADAIRASGVPATRITIVGGPHAVADQVRDRIAAAAGWNGQGTNPVVRVAGDTRYDTAAAVATHIATLSRQPGGVPLAASYRTIIVATGDHPSDALAASTLAYRGQHLLLLSPRITPTSALDTATSAVNANCAIVVGGTNAVDTAITTSLDDTLATSGAGACRTQRLAGTDRYHTATLIASRLATTYGAPNAVQLANPRSSSLPLTAAPLARGRTPLLYTSAGQLAPITRTWLTQHPTITPPVEPPTSTTTTTTTVAGSNLSLTYATTQFDTAQTSQTLTPTPTGGTGPYTYAITGGTLPPGITFHTTTGAFTGPTSWGLTNIATISAGGYHTCAILTDTTARCWGYNQSGQLGDDTTTNRLTPVTVTTGAGTPLTGITHISAGVDHTCAVLTDGTARCWGDNQYGQLGNGEVKDYPNSAVPSPVTVTTGAGTPLTGITQISAGWEHTCAVLAGGTARCWGGNGQGRLGDGTNTNRSSPVTVTTGAGTPLKNVTHVSASHHAHTCALLTDGTARCWGAGTLGRLGNGLSNMNTSTSVIVLTSGNDQSGPSLSGITHISAGSEHTCAVLAGGTARCWGNNDSGRLGDGTTTDQSTPVTVGAGTPLTGITHISAGDDHTCAVLAGGTARCWGNNGSGRLGDGSTTTPRLNPVAVGSLVFGTATLTVTITDAHSATVSAEVTLTTSP